MISVETVENPFRFPGQYYDQETGLHYNWNRYYDPKTGRYLTPDPIGLEGGINLFLYAASNALNRFDPDGLFHYKPGVVPANGDVEAMLRCMDMCLNRDLGISGGKEKRKDTHSCHPLGCAADISYRMNPGLAKEKEKVMCCAKKCGAGYGLIENDHCHVQTYMWDGKSRGDLPDCGCDRQPEW